ncbi:equilibrative nucleoside transporter 1-like, partial [Agrilus planipennis]|uniref:Equilibrative nucleoside transporter 1-like n=1 Tax=Agrilus planipennis TaxID=224129 RepID=A0A1W4XRU1_AGRPL
AIFPAIQANIQISDLNFFVGTTHYINVLCFLTFNVSAMVGSFLPRYFTYPKPRFLWIPVTLRLLYIPFFLLCNYQLSDRERILPVLISSDWAYWIVGITMGLTSGYFSSLGMMYAPRTVEPQYAATAGMFGAAALITGIFSGVLLSFVWPWLIQHVGF